VTLVGRGQGKGNAKLFSARSAIQAFSVPLWGEGVPRPCGADTLVRRRCCCFADRCTTPTDGCPSFRAFCERAWTQRVSASVLARARQQMPWKGTASAMPQDRDQSCKLARARLKIRSAVNVPTKTGSGRINTRRTAQTNCTLKQCDPCGGWPHSNDTTKHTISRKCGDSSNTPTIRLPALIFRQARQAA
jgi:hypothetical protein